jgi:ABC-type nickel/cobalt efflux system permease component RcnA
MNKKWHRFGLGLISFLVSLCLSIHFATPSLAHWADLSVAEVIVGETETQITLTLPTGLVALADDNRDGHLVPDEVRNHQAALQTFLGDRIRLTDGENHYGILTVQPSETAALNLKTPVSTHSTLMLVYTWSQPGQGLKIYYDLFLPGGPTARCLAIITTPASLPGRTSLSGVQKFIFSPETREFSLNPGSPWQQAGSLLIASTMGAFLWGAMHALSPGHGKTVVGAYLVGSRATPQHALFLGLTVAITHTTGVFALGLVTLFASHHILPEQLYPWLSVLSGLLVVAIGLNLFIKRMRSSQLLRRLPFGHSQANHHTTDAHSHRHHHHEHAHEHHHHHHDDHFHHHHHPHGHSHGLHSHLPPGADGSPVTWRSLLALGISGGLVPCPSALVLLLGAIAVGHITFGLLLVLAFSLGLAGVLIGLGLFLVYAKQHFERLPTQIRLARMFPALSALFVTLVGLGITMQALYQIGLVQYRF